jgi:MOSC domain-containing protein YiiM
LEGSVLQINISPGGLPKFPILHADVTALGIEGDRHKHPRFHGGPRKALLIVTSEGIEELAAQGFPLYAGALGENITTRGIDRRWMRSGQRYRIGDILIELTTLRVPCDQLVVYGPGLGDAVYDAEVKAGNFRSPKWALGGFYAAVMQAGRIQPGDPIQLLEELA